MVFPNHLYVLDRKEKVEEMMNYKCSKCLKYFAKKKKGLLHIANKCIGAGLEHCNISNKKAKDKMIHTSGEQ